MKIISNVNLSPFNSFKASANAKNFIYISSVGEAAEFADSHYSRSEFIILGGGSNYLFIRDEYETILKIDLQSEYEASANGDYIDVKLSSGTKWDDFVAWSVENNYYGAENLADIPGLIGAAPVQNIGAYGADQSQLLQSVEYYDLIDKSIKNICAKDCKFAYRSSIFKSELKNRALILSAVYRLSRVPKLNLEYSGLKGAFPNNPAPSSKEVYNEIKRIRKSKLPELEKFGSAGSFFKNPIIDKNHFLEIQKIFPEAPHYRDGEQFKIPAAFLIEKAGFKGSSVGDCACWEKQPLIIINKGQAKGIEIFEFSESIRKEVKSIFNIDLEREAIAI